MNHFETYRVMHCGSAGVIKDINPHMLPPEAWTFANQVQFNGIDAIQEKPVKTLLATGYPVQLLVGWNDGLKGRLLLATSQGIKEVSHIEHDATTSDVIDRSRIDQRPVRLNQWTGGAFGGIPYFCAGLGRTPLVLMPDRRGQSKDQFEDLNHWPPGHSCSVLRHFANHLIAIKFEVEATIDGSKTTIRRPFDIVWSDRAEPGQVPKTWDPAAEGSRAGKTALTDGGDKVVDGTTLGSRFCVYKEESIWPIKHVGGNYVFSFDHAIQGVGIMGKNCAVDFHGKNYVFGRDEIFAHDGWQIERIFNARINRWMFNRIADKKRHLCHVFKRPKTREIYFCFPNGDVDFANMAACYHTERKTATLKTFEQGINTGMVFEFTSDETRGKRRPFIGYGQGIQELDAIHSGRDFRLERDGIDLGQRRQVEMTQHIYLYASGTGSVEIEIEGTFQNGERQIRKINYPLDTAFPGQPVEVSGLYHMLRITNHDALDFRLSGYTMSFHGMGEY